MGWPTVGISDSVTNDAVARDAVSKVGKHAVIGSKTRGHGIDCFALVDQVLRESGAKSAADFGPLSAHASYVWGESIAVDEVKPGDILQFKDHLVSTQTSTRRQDGKWFVTEELSQTRPHHSAIVVQVLSDGSVDVVEQNTKPNPQQILRHNIPRLESGSETRLPNHDSKIKITVTGFVKAYRPVSTETNAPTP